jgi:hypothetical protein
MRRRVPQFARYKWRSNQRSMNLRGSPLRSPHSYWLVKLVAVIRARDEIDRNASCAALSRGRSIA